MEGDLSCLDLPVLGVDLVADHHDGHVLHHSGQVLVPLGDAFVGDARSDVEHEDGCVGANVVSLPQPAQLLLTGCVPEVDSDRPVRREKCEGTDLYALGGNVSFLELAGDVTLQERGLPHAAVADQHYLELNCRGNRGVGVGMGIGLK